MRVATGERIGVWELPDGGAAEVLLSFRSPRRLFVAAAFARCFYELDVNEGHAVEMSVSGMSVAEVGFAAAAPRLYGVTSSRTDPTYVIVLDMHTGRKIYRSPVEPFVGYTAALSADGSHLAYAHRDQITLVRL